MSETLVQFSKILLSEKKSSSSCVQWNGSALYVLTDKTLQIYDFDDYLPNGTKDISVKNYYILCPSAAQLTEQVESPGPPQQEIYINPTLWGCSDALSSEILSIASYKCSPPENKRSKVIVALLSNHGCLQLYVRTRSGVYPVVNVTDKIIEMVQYNKYNSTEDKFRDILTSSFCWGFSLRDDEHVLITAHKNDNIIFWKFSSQDICKFSIEYLLKYELCIGEIKTIDFIQKNTQDFLLLLSTFKGTIHLLNGNIQKDNISIKSIKVLWPHEDSILLKHVTWYKKEDRFVIICAKYRYLIAFLISENDVVLSQYIENISDYTITALTKNGEEVYIGTEEFVLYKLNISTDDDNIKIQSEKIKLNDDYSTYILKDIALSRNKALLAMSTMEKHNHRFHKKQLSIFLLKFDSFNPLETVISKVDSDVKQMLDCLEIIKINFLKDKMFDDRVERMFSNPNLTTYEMKLYLRFWKIFHMIDYLRDPPAKSVFSTLDVSVVRDTILLRHAVNVIHRLFEADKTSGALNTFQKDTYESCYMFIIYYSEINCTNVSSYLKNELIEFANKVNAGKEIKCLYCDEYLKNYKCVHGHPNQFCTLTFQQITSLEYLACEQCGSTARAELLSDRPICLFCDVLLEKHC